MRRVMVVLLCLALLAANEANSRELVHAYPPTGPVEVAGAATASKVLRTVQRYAAPAFTDVLAMHVAQTLRGAADEPVIVTRKSRQGGHEAASTVASASADGRTLLLASSVPEASTAGSRAMSPPGLQPVALVASMPFVAIASSDSKHANLGDLMREVKLTSSRLLVGTAGGKTAGHLALERLRSRHGPSIEAVAYNGGVAAMNAVATNQVGIALVPLPSVLPYLGTGRVKVLAVAEKRRHPSIPQVQTSTEAGFPDFEATGWFGVFAAAATPSSVINDLNASLARSDASEQTRAAFHDFGLRLEYRPANVFARLLEPEPRAAPESRVRGGIRHSEARLR